MSNRRALPVADPAPGPALDRRQAVRALLTGAGAGLAVPGLARAHPLVGHAHHAGRIEDAREKAADPSGAPEFLDAYTYGMLETLGERLVPGASVAVCARFIDRLLAVGTTEEGQEFLTALGAIDGAARERFAAPWTDLTGAQQVELLDGLSMAAPGREAPPWTPGTSVAEHLSRTRESEGAPLTLRDRLDHVKGWVMGAYYSSEVGLRELGYDGPVFADSFPGCPHPDGHE